VDVDLAKEDVESAEGEECRDGGRTVARPGGVSTFFSVSTCRKSS